jgi:hypothetical protein
VGTVVVLGVVFASSASAASGGGCQLDGTANISPGLTNTSQSFNYNFSGGLSRCQSNQAGAPTSGTVEAGQVVTAPSGEQFQQTSTSGAPSGTGSCGSSTTSGIAIVTWADSTVTVVSYTTTGATAAVNLTGTVIASVTLQAINPAPGQPASETITTTRYAGQSALGVLAFQPSDPTACGGTAGVTTAKISGFIGLVSQN